MGDKMRITIDVEGGTEDATIECNGEKYTVHGLALFADGGTGNLFTFTWNSPIIAAQAVIKSCACAMRREDPFATQFYMCLLRGFAMVTGQQPKPNDDGLETLERWEAEDIEAMKKIVFN